MNIGHAQAHILKKLGRHQFLQRQLNRSLTHLARFISTLPGASAASAEDVAELALDFIEEAIESSFESCLRFDFVKDGTGCIRAQEPPKVHNRKIDVSIKHCTPDRIKCTIHNFFVSSRDKFLQTRQLIDSLPEDELTTQLQNFSKIISDAEQDPRILSDDRVCANLGDALIVVDGSTGNPVPEMVSSNASEHQVVCKAIGSRFVHYKPLRP
ncbi:MAG: hypothetical protein ACYCW6_32670 [Candidatus Xenobia bacterium]